MMLPSHDVAMSTDPSPVAALPTRIVVHACAGPTAEARDPTRRWTTAILLKTLSIGIPFFNRLLVVLPVKLLFQDAHDNRQLLLQCRPGCEILG